MKDFFEFSEKECFVSEGRKFGNFQPFGDFQPRDKDDGDDEDVYEIMRSC